MNNTSVLTRVACKTFLSHFWNAEWASYIALTPGNAPFHSALVMFPPHFPKKLPLTKLLIRYTVFIKQNPFILAPLFAALQFVAIRSAITYAGECGALCGSQTHCKFVTLLKVHTAFLCHTRRVCNSEYVIQGLASHRLLVVFYRCLRATSGRVQRRAQRGRKWSDRQRQWTSDVQPTGR